VRGIAFAGDLNGDGTSDIVVAGDHTLYVYPGGVAPFATAPSQTIDMGVPVRQLAGLGDVQGDALADLGVGSADTPSGTQNMTVSFGAFAAGLSPLPGSTLMSTLPPDGFGWSIE
jgi:hypothetical protein